MRILITGASGKVGTRLLRRLLSDPRFDEARFRGLCFSRDLETDDPRVESMRGSIADRAVAEAAMRGVTHVIHLATSKESPDTIMDVAVKGLFWLLEEFRVSASAKQFILVGGDAALGHFFYPYAEPITERDPFRATPGCYGLSKVLEEVMLEQYCIQYDINGCCLRAPWLMADDDFRRALSFGPDVFGVPRWHEEVGADRANALAAAGAVPVALDADGKPLRRNMLHVDDLAGAILAALDNPAACRQTFNVAMDEPVDYAVAAVLIGQRTGAARIEVPTPYFSTWLDNGKAKQLLGWQPAYALADLIDAAWSFKRNEGEIPAIRYPG